jgi:putative transposase
MTTSRFKNEQIIGALRQAEKDVAIKDICRNLGIAEQTFFRRKSKPGDMDVPEAKRQHELEDKNRRLEQRVAE